MKRKQKERGYGIGKRAAEIHRRNILHGVEPKQFLIGEDLEAFLVRKNLK